MASEELYFVGLFGNNADEFEEGNSDCGRNVTEIGGCGEDGAFVDVQKVRANAESDERSACELYIGRDERQNRRIDEIAHA
jgi:hypothetical protein